MTDSSTVTARPTQAEAWKKYAVTAVGFRIVLPNDPTRSVHTFFCIRPPLLERSLLPTSS